MARIWKKKTKAQLFLLPEKIQDHIPHSPNNPLTIGYTDNIQPLTLKLWKKDSLGQEEEAWCYKPCEAILNQGTMSLWDAMRSF